MALALGIKSCVPAFDKRDPLATYSPRCARAARRAGEDVHGRAGSVIDALGGNR